MRDQPIVIQCEFEPDGKRVNEILEESFALFLRRTFVNSNGNTVKYQR